MKYKKITGITKIYKMIGKRFSSRYSKILFNCYYCSFIYIGYILLFYFRYIATGDSFKTIGHSYRMGFTTVGIIVKEVSKVIWKALQPLYLPFPTEQIWKQSEKDFKDRWGFPNCIGSIDGKHVSIKCPPNSGTLYFCYKQKFSIVLLAIVDSDYKFIMVDVGSYGKDSDSTIFQSSLFYQKLIDNQLNIPGPKPLPGRQQQTPHVFIGDGGFKLEPFLMRPFPNDVALQDVRKLKFNKRLSCARRIVESSFGILVQKWRCFLRPFELNVNTIVDVVKAACCLHNFLRCKGENELNEDEDIALLRNARALRNFEPTNSRSSTAAYAVREQFISYFNE